MSENSFDIAVIGGGPAGMSAALCAARHGAKVILLNDKSKVGGQIYRNVTDSPLPDVNVLGEDYTYGQQLVERFEKSDVEVINDATVWHVGMSGEVLFSKGQKTFSLNAREVMVSCGAMERPFPVPGWHLPGVMSAGSAQVMLKSDGIVKDDAIFVGCGPLLYLIVAQYLRLGVKVKALVDTTSENSVIHALSNLSAVLSQPAMLKKGIGLLNEIKKAGVPHYKNAEKIQVLGTDQVEGVQFEINGREQTIESSHVFLHQGVIPNLNFTRALNLDHYWNGQQKSWQPNLNEWGQSSIPHVSVAGDASAIVGAIGAELTGQLVALNQLYKLGFLSQEQRNSKAQPLKAELDKLNRFRKFIDNLYMPSEAHRLPENADTIVCRCEERTVQDLFEGFQNGGDAPDSLKGLTRSGMGPCQGRQCGHTVSELLAKWQNKSPEEIGYYRMRSPMRLLPLTEFADFNVVTPDTVPLQEDCQ